MKHLQFNKRIFDGKRLFLEPNLSRQRFSLDVLKMEEAFKVLPTKEELKFSEMQMSAPVFYNLGNFCIETKIEKKQQNIRLKK